MTDELSELGLVIAAAHFAADKHRDQRRKGTRSTPYINHPLEVAETLSRIAAVDDPHVLAAAILHDTIEDTRTTAAELTTRFGRRISDIVVELSDDRSLSWQERKRQEIAHAPHLTADARRIKLADKMCNVADTIHNPPGDWSLGRRRDYIDFAEQVAAGCRGVDGLLDAAFDQILAEARGKLG